MPVYIRQIGTAVPEWSYPQEFARERMKGWVDDNRVRRLVHGVYTHSGIQRRHSVLGDFGEDAVPELFRTGPDGRLIEPGTGERNEVYIRESKKLVSMAARRALDGSPDIRRSDITHVVVASCTGFYNPGPDYHLLKDLGLAPNVQRYVLGFMGCYAAFPAMRMAQQFCEADPKAVVLIVSVELCSLHLHIDKGTDSLLGNALFADGAAAALVSGSVPNAGARALCVRNFESTLAPESEEHMAWSIGNEGFKIVLTGYVPGIIGAHIERILEPVLAVQNMSLSDVDHWAVHPGGKAILDKVERALGLGPDALDVPRGVLREYGNMSSATILFVLKEILERRAPAHGEQICAMAFGPGLTIETGILEVCHAAVPEQATEGLHTG